MLYDDLCYSIIQNVIGIVIIFYKHRNNKFMIQILWILSLRLIICTFKLKNSEICIFCLNVPKYVKICKIKFKMSVTQTIIHISIYTSLILKCI